MSADILQFGVFAESSKGLLARPIIQNNVIGLKSMFDSAAIDIYKLGAGGPPVHVDLDVNTIMYDQLQEWKKDNKGYSLFIDGDGAAWWPDPASSYRLVVSLVSKIAYGGKKYLIVWQANTVDPKT